MRGCGERYTVWPYFNTGCPYVLYNNKGLRLIYNCKLIIWKSTSSSLNKYENGCFLQKRNLLTNKKYWPYFIYEHTQEQMLAQHNWLKVGVKPLQINMCIQGIYKSKTLCYLNANKLINKMYGEEKTTFDNY